jgi:hypothetical protein
VFLILFAAAVSKAMAYGFRMLVIDIRKTGEALVKATKARQTSKDLTRKI